MTLSRDHAAPHALNETTVAPPAGGRPGRPMRSAAVAGLVLIWGVAGLVLGADVLGLLLLAIPFAVAVQFVRRAPVRQLWAPDTTTFARRCRGKVLVGVALVLLAAAMVAEKAGSWTDDGWQAVAFVLLLLVGYVVVRRFFVVVVVASVAVTAAGVLLAPDLASTRTGDPVVLGHLAQQEEFGQLDGFRDLAVAEVDIHSGQPVRLAGIGATSNTPMEVGSISKVMTGLVIADSVRRGELDLAAPVSAYLPELEGSPAGDVTMRELVTHTAGYTDFGPSAIRRAAWRAPLGLNFLDEGITAMIADARGGDLSTRGHFVYSSLGAAIAGQALMRVTEMSYPDLIQSRLLRPIGMTQTFVQTNPTVTGGQSASGLPAHPWVLNAYAPAGAVVSTTHDLAMLASALLNRTAPGTSAMRPIAATDQANTQVGVFWRVSHWQTGHTITWHAGETGGYGSYLGLDRAHGHAVIVLSDVAAEQTTNLGINLLANRS